VFGAAPLSALAFSAPPAAVADAAAPAPQARVVRRETATPEFEE
jgi:hypothetical protein